MMDSKPLDADQIVVLSAEFNALANHARGMLNEPNISPTNEQACFINDYSTRLSETASNLARVAANVAFDASDDAFTTIHKQTAAACDTVGKLKREAAKTQAVIDVLGAAVDLGLAFAKGPASGVIAAAGSLEAAIAKA